MPFHTGREKKKLAASPARRKKVFKSVVGALKKARGGSAHKSAHGPTKRKMK